MRQPREVRNCHYPPCHNFAVTKNRRGRPRDYCSDEHRRDAERHQGALPQLSASLAHPLSHPAARHAYGLLIAPAVQKQLAYRPDPTLAKAIARAVTALRDANPRA